MVPLDDLRLQTSERNSFWVMLMLQTQGELSESMSYFGLGSSNSSTQARTHSPGRSSGGGFCDQRQRARHLINDCLWFTAVAQQRKVLQRRASRSCTSISSPGQTSPRSRMRYRLAELRNSKQVFGPPRWKCAGEERSNRGRANGVKGHQRGGVQYLQPTTGAESKARLSRYKLQSWCHFLGLPQSFPVKYLQALKLQLLRSAGPLCAPAAGRDVISQIWGRCGISVTNTAKGEGFPQSRFSVRAVS